MAEKIYIAGKPNSKVFELKEKKGVFFSNGVSLAVDPSSKSKSDKVIISHAHSDHASIPKKSQSEFVLTKSTYALLSEKFNGTVKATPVRLGKKVDCGSYSFALKEAGHILGSGQVLIEGEKTIAVTNDFKLQDSLLHNQAEILPCDILVIESTFGLPEFSFPEREASYEKISAWLKQETGKGNFAVLAGYSLGKAQELTKVVNEYTGLTPLVYEKVHDFNQIYQSEGVDLGEFIKLNHNLQESNVLILPPHLVDHSLIQFLKMALKRKIVSAIATGWQQRRNGFDQIFSLSDHADFNQLMHYVKEANPKMVLTQHGFAQEFANFVGRRLGIPARPLADYKQKNLIEFLG